MITVVLDIDNRMAHGCSPLEYLRKYILQDATKKEDAGAEYHALFYNSYAEIKVISIRQD